MSTETEQPDETAEPPDFEAALAELEALVDQMETGNLSLEASLAAFERGVNLTRTCQSALRAAELRVRMLTRDDSLEDLDLDALDEA
ncbi:MAG: exodeoxyribonuclease VII small subunit [Gammaproteobacteria bacterium]